MDVVEILDYILMVFVFIVGTFGNGLVIISIFKFSWLKTQTNVFVALLAFFDLMYAFLSQIVQQIANVILYISNKSTVGYEIFCTAYGTITLFCGMGDVISIVFITIDRYIHIHHPLKYEMILTMKRAKVMCACL